eukprot:TRINITY_DN29883_c0_g1_i1.p1 TRINITY_DN29883_c0_g1~~TRINITY_DN29883_c0_g1_i1.p1  ORF type:complete len:738 (-),score=126.54 TRINITY_DN29883_c0_g1_i1:50-2263(-)
MILRLPAGAGRWASCVGIAAMAFPVQVTEQAQVYFRPDSFPAVEGINLLQHHMVTVAGQPRLFLHEEPLSALEAFATPDSCGGCSGHGLCSADGAGHAVCVCHSGWGGVRCGQPEARSLDERTLAAWRAREQMLAADLQRESQRLAGNGLMQRPASAVQLYRASQVQRVQNVVQAASQAADRLLARARLQARRDAAQRLNSALQRAAQGAHQLPGTDFLHPEDLVLEQNEQQRGDAVKLVQQDSVSSKTSACGTKSSCSGHGTCDLATGSCTCEEGWSGELCDILACKEDCNNNGLCIAGRCICHAGFLGETCGHKRCPNDCSGNGYCWSGRCQCTGGFGGEDCSQTVHSSKVISLRLDRKTPFVKGAPDLSVSTVRASSSATPCEASTTCSGHGQCDAEGQCSCDVFYYGPHCNDHCEGGCSGHGDCLTGGTCLCSAGWSGAQCGQQAECSGRGTRKAGVADRACECDAGWTGNDCELEAECPDPTCSGHGVCQSTGSCLCGPGYSGLACELARTGCSVTGCGANGECDEVTSTCNCKTGYVGLTCETALWHCPSDCSGHGTCMGGFCACWPKWEGDACDHPEASLADAANATLGLLANVGASPEESSNVSASQPAAALLYTEQAHGERTGLNLGRAASVGPSTAAWIPAAASVVPPAAALSSRQAGADAQPSERIEAAEQGSPDAQAPEPLDTSAQLPLETPTLVSAPVGTGLGPSGGSSLLMSLLGQAAQPQGA